MSYLVFEIPLRSITEGFEVVHPEFFLTKLEALKYVQKQVKFDDKISVLDFNMVKYMSPNHPKSCIRSVIFGETQYEIHRVRPADPMIDQEHKFPHAIVKYSECIPERVWGFNCSAELHSTLKNLAHSLDLKFGSKGKCSKCKTLWIHLIHPEDEFVNYVAYIKV